MIPGSTITLRDPDDGDATLHAALPPSPEIIRMYGGETGSLPKPSLARSKDWLEWLHTHPFNKIILRNEVAVGHVRLHSLSQTDRRARLALGLFRDADLGQGIGRQAIRLTLDHAFGPMGLHRIDLRVLAYNLRAIRCYTACGFRHEGTEREAAWIDAAWHDDWIMGILADEHAAAKAGH